MHQHQIEAVYFDVGGVLIDETRIYTEWAHWFGVSPFDFFGLLGAVIERGQHHLRAFEAVRPGFDLAAEEAARLAAGCPNVVKPEDLFADVEGCLRGLLDAGLRVGVAGNQPTTTEAVLKAAGLPAEVIASSESWGVEKPDPAFFTRLAAEAGLPPAAIAYVGDRLDNDVAPAAAAGMLPVFLERGPWARIHRTWPGIEQAAVHIRTLAELPAALAPFARPR